MKSQIIGRYIVTDPKICHGKPTFRGTRIMVADVLEQVAEGLAWESQRRMGRAIAKPIIRHGAFGVN